MEKPSFDNNEYLHKIEKSDITIANEEIERKHGSAYFRLGKGFELVSKDDEKTIFNFDGIMIEEWSSALVDDPNFSESIRKMESLW